jgi:general secretion pathway protein D
MLPLVAAALVALSGCAAQQAFRQGDELLRQGRTQESLPHLEEASRLEPGSAQYRLALLRARQARLAELLDAADRARRERRYAAADAGYRQALALEGGSDRALAGLRAIDHARRLQSRIEEAQAAMVRGDAAAALEAARAVLAEEPDHLEALALAQQARDAAPPRPAAASALAEAYRKPIGIEFRDAPLKAVFEVIARTAGLNFIFDKDVKTDARTSIFLRHSSIEAAVNLTLLTHQLEQRVLDANTVLIYPATAAKLKDYQPLSVRSFYLAHAEAKTVAATLKGILKTRDVVVDDKLNMLILRDSPEAIRLAEKLVALHDVPEAEVMLEVEILEVKRTRLLDLGIRWPDQLSLSPLPATNGGTLRLSDLRGINSGTLAASVGPATVNARKQDTDANILANPRIRVRNREKAKILIGERVPNISSTATSTGFVSETVNYVDVGLKLDVEPVVYRDGEVAIRVAMEVSSIINQIQTKAGSVAYQIGTRTAQTVLRLKDGENQVLAGLISDEDRRTGYKVPALGEVPVLGRLFGSQADDASKTEIVLSITPRIVRNLRRMQPEALEFESGTESSLADRTSMPLSGSSAPPDRDERKRSAQPPEQPLPGPGGPPGSRPAPGTGAVPAAPNEPGEPAPGSGAASPASGSARSGAGSLPASGSAPEAQGLALVPSTRLSLPADTAVTPVQVVRLLP